MRGGILQGFSAVAMFAAFIYPVSSYASCEQRDIAGDWQFFFSSYATTVTLSISDTGEITQGSYAQMPWYLSGELSAGYIEVKTNCRLAGEFHADENPDTFGSVDFKILDARTRPDPEYWAGTFEYSFKLRGSGLNPERKFYRGTFNAVRILPE